MKHKAEQFLDAMEQIDPAYLEDARAPKKRNLWQRAETPLRRFGLIAAAMVLVVGLAAGATAAYRHFSGINVERVTDATEDGYWFTLDEIPPNAPATLERNDLPLCLFDNPDFSVDTCTMNEWYTFVGASYTKERIGILYEQRTCRDPDLLHIPLPQWGEEEGAPYVEIWEDTLGEQRVLCYSYRNSSPVNYLWVTDEYCYSLYFTSDPGKEVLEEVYASIQGVENSEDYIIEPPPPPWMDTLKIEAFYLPLGVANFPVRACHMEEYNGKPYYFEAVFGPLGYATPLFYKQTALSPFDLEAPAFYEEHGEIHTATVDGTIFTWQYIDDTNVAVLRWKDDFHHYELINYNITGEDSLRQLLQGMQEVDPADYPCE